MKALDLSKPHALIMVGTPGSGKSSFAAKFARDFNAPFIDFEKILDRASDNQKLAKAIMNDMLAELYKTKQFIVFDGYGNDTAERLELSNSLHKHGYQPFVVWVQTDPMTLKVRLMKKYKNSGSESEVDNVTDHLIDDYVQPRDNEVSVVISGRHTYSSQAQTVLRKLTSKHSGTKIDKSPERLAAAKASKPASKSIAVSQALSTIESSQEDAPEAKQATKVHAPRQTPPLTSGRRDFPNGRRLQ